MSLRFSRPGASTRRILCQACEPFAVLERLGIDLERDLKLYDRPRIKRKADVAATNQCADVVHASLLESRTVL
jgi:hypothetical protein